MQEFFITLLKPCLADVVAAAVIGQAVFAFQLFDFALVDAADVADDMREHFALRILAEQPCLGFDTGEAVAVRCKARDFLVREPGADGQTFEAFAFLEQLAEAAAVTGSDFNHLGKFVNRRVQVRYFAGRDFKRVSGIVMCQLNAVTVNNDPPMRRDGLNRYAVGFSKSTVVTMLDHLQVEITHEKKTEQRQHKDAEHGETAAEALQFALGVADLDAGVDRKIRHGPGLGEGAGAVSANG